MHALPADELADAVRLAGDGWETLRGRRFLITGGTGFVGRWLVETLLTANRSMGLGVEILLLTRNRRAVLERAPHFEGAAGLKLLEGDVRKFPFPQGEFSDVIHAASGGHVAESVTAVLDTILLGTRRVLDFAEARGVRRILFLSSGAVYGPQPADLPCFPEDFAGAPRLGQLGSAYGEAKRAAELMCLACGRESGIEIKLARGFAFIGPCLPLDGPFAAGNFIGAALSGRPIEVQGSSETVRSYLYAMDMAAWLWAILLRGESGRAYHVGSGQPLTIRMLAEAVAAEVSPTPEIHMGSGDLAPSRYVPCVERARTELGVEVTVPIKTAIRRTLAWHKS